jgi:hypothetical protein
MAKKKTSTIDVLPDDVLKELQGPAPTDVELVSTPKTLVALIEAGQIAQIPTNRLAPLYIVLDAMKKRIEKLLEKIKDKNEQTAGLQSRRGEGIVCGEKNQHRRFEYPGIGTLEIQEKKNWQPDPDKLVALLKKKKLWATACNVTVNTSGDAFLKHVKAHRKEFEALGVTFTEELDMEKVNGLCMAKLITEEELEEILDKPDPTYSLVPKLEKK